VFSIARAARLHACQLFRPLLSVVDVNSVRHRQYLFTHLQKPPCLIANMEDDGEALTFETLAAATARALSSFDKQIAERRPEQDEKGRLRMPGHEKAAPDARSS